MDNKKEAAAAVAGPEFGLKGEAECSSNTVLKSIHTRAWSLFLVLGGFRIRKRSRQSCSAAATNGKRSLIVIILCCARSDGAGF